VIRIRPLLAAIVLATFAAAGATSQPVPAPDNAEKEPAPIVVNTTVDRTAVWIGDPVVYTIEITCPPGSDVLAADISRERLKLRGLEVASAIQQREEKSDGTIVYLARFRLVSFVTDGSSVGIEPQPVRYYVHTAGQPPETLVPADEVQLPARRIAVRSTLPGGDVEWIRDARAIGTLPSFVGYLRAIGVTVVALTLVPVVVGLSGIARGWKPRRRTGRSRRHALQLHQEALEQVRGLDASTDADVRRDVFGRLNTIIRDRLTDLGIPARNLTPDEIEVSIAGRYKELAAGDIAEILRGCERAAYGRADELPGPEAVSAALGQAERLLTARAR